MNNEVTAFMDHSINAPGDGFKHIIHHPIEPVIVSQNCQVVKNGNSLELYYGLENPDYDDQRPMVQERDSNETTFEFRISNKLSFVEINNQ